jgi:hypothetical protein
MLTINRPGTLDPTRIFTVNGTCDTNDVFPDPGAFILMNGQTPIQQSVSRDTPTTYHVTFQAAQLASVSAPATLVVTSICAGGTTQAIAELDVAPPVQLTGIDTTTAGSVIVTGKLASIYDDVDVGPAATLTKGAGTFTYTAAVPSGTTTIINFTAKKGGANMASFKIVVLAK